MTSQHQQNQDYNQGKIVDSGIDGLTLSGSVLIDKANENKNLTSQTFLNSIDNDLSQNILRGFYKTGNVLI